MSETHLVHIKFFEKSEKIEALKSELFEIVGGFFENKMDIFENISLFYFDLRKFRIVELCDFIENNKLSGYFTWSNFQSGKTDFKAFDNKNNIRITVESDMVSEESEKVITRIIGGLFEKADLGKMVSTENTIITDEIEKPKPTILSTDNTFLKDVEKEDAEWGD